MGTKQNKPGKPEPATRLVYSTNPLATLPPPGQEEETLPPGSQQLRIGYETKHRGGKAVSIVTGFAGSQADLDALGKLLKQACGTGGSVKDGAILIQGDHREKLLKRLVDMGYVQTKKAGG